MRSSLRTPAPSRRALLVVLGALILALGSSGCGDTRVSPLDTAWRSGLSRIDDALQRKAYRAALEELGLLKSQVDQLAMKGDADSEAIERVRENLECLKMEIQAWEALDDGNRKLASGLVGLAQTQKDCTGDMLRRLESLEARAEDVQVPTTPPPPRPPRPRPDRPPPVVGSRPDPGSVPEVHGIEWLAIEGRRYEIGTPEQERGRESDLEVTPRSVLVDAFLVSRTEVTQRTYSYYVPKSWNRFPGSETPAHSVNFEEAVGFCEELTRRIPEYVFSLPRETEWEVACRGTRSPTVGPVILPDTKDQQSVTNGPPDKAEWVLQKYAWFGKMRSGPQPVAGLAATCLLFDRHRECGLFDMHGNVAEWCVRDESVPWKQPGLLEQPTRGGSYLSSFDRCRAGARAFQRSDSRLPTIGFRIIARPR